MAVSTMLFVSVVLLSSSTATANVDVFRSRPADTLVLLNDDAQLNCSFNTQPTSTRWVKGHRRQVVAEGRRVISGMGKYKLGEDYNLIIRNATLESTGTYSCEYRTDDQIASTANLYVIDRVPNCSSDRGFTAVAGQNTTFTCSMDLDAAAPGDLVWYMNGVEVSRESGMSNTWTTIFDVENDGATLNCRLEHSTLSEDKWESMNCGDDVVLDSAISPVLHREVKGNADDKGTVVEGNPISVECTVSSSNPGVDTLYWTNQDNVVVSQGSILSFVSISRHQAGTYTCIAQNTFRNGAKGTASIDVRIDVQYWDGVSVQDRSNRKVVEGQTYQANCTAAANPPAKLLWISIDGVTNESPNLVITNASRHDVLSLQPMCSAWNHFWDGTRNNGHVILDIDVQYPPEITLQVSGEADRNGTTTEGKSLSVECVITASNPDTDLIYWSDGEHSFVSDGRTIHFDSASRYRRGNYTCTAENTFWDGSKGITSKATNIDVQYWDGITVRDLSSRKVIEGQTYHANCTASANPPASVFLDILDGTISNSFQIAIENVERGNTVSRQPTCMAGNKFWDGTRNNGFLTVDLDVEFWDGVTVQDDSDGKVIEGQTYYANCTASSNPPANIFWIFLNGQITIGPHLSVRNVTRGDQDALQITCIAGNKYWDGTRNNGHAIVNIDVQYEPNVEITDANGFVEVEGRPYSVHCSATGNPTPLVYWEGRENEGRPSDHTLVIDDVSREHEGKYTCVAINTFWDGLHGTSASSFVLEVQYPPEVTFQRDAIICKEGDSITLSCHVESNPLAHSIKWTKDGFVKSVEQYYDIGAIERQDHGVYTCTAKNTFYDSTEGVGNNSMTVTVQYLPDVTINGPLRPVVEFTSSSVTCNTVEGQPLPYRITLLKFNGTRPLEIAQVTNTSGVTELSHDVAATERWMNGSYYCNVITRFYDGTEESVTTPEVDVIVHYPPEFMNASETIVVTAMGEQLVLRCVADAYPVADVFWTDADGNTLESVETVQGTVITSEVVIDKVNRSKLETYVCTFSNEIGNATSYERQLAKVENSDTTRRFSIAGVVIGVVVVVIALATITVVAVFCNCRQNSNHAEEEEQEDDTGSAYAFPDPPILVNPSVIRNEPVSEIVTETPDVIQPSPDELGDPYRTILDPIDAGQKYTPTTIL
ncbi:hemicentin-1-like isoform X2 [Ptychodera flava]|uniref:hemicentin-1-like isoform X2 n=1 Tax=Ptychodera flava TaxID=63121 RepID=UPI00396A2D66